MIGKLDLIDDAEAGGTPEVAVEESDIWKVVGETLYYFNRSRGLQIFDLSDPSNPVMTGSVRLPAVGDQLYVMGSDTVLLLANSGGWNESEVIQIVTEDGVPAIENRL